MIIFRRVLDKRALEMLELNAGKLARSVLRGGGGGNTVSLPDQEKKVKHRRRRRRDCGKVGKSAAVSTFPQSVWQRTDQKQPYFSRGTTNEAYGQIE